jgi:hypothetical protein
MEYEWWNHSISCNGGLIREKKKRYIYKEKKKKKDCNCGLTTSKQVSEITKLLRHSKRVRGVNAQ